VWGAESDTELQISKKRGGQQSYAVVKGRRKNWEKKRVGEKGLWTKANRRD